MRDKQFFDLVEQYRQQYPEIQRVLQIFDDAETHLTRLDKLALQNNMRTTISANAGGGIYGPPKITTPFLTETTATTEG